MRYNDYSHRHGKELLQVLHPDIAEEIHAILSSTDPFAHGAIKGRTAKDYIADAFAAQGWEKEARGDFGTDKADALDLCKWKVAIEAGEPVPSCMMATVFQSWTCSTSPNAGYGQPTTASTPRPCGVMPSSTWYRC